MKLSALGFLTFLAASSFAGAAVTYTSGHADLLSVAYQDGGLRLQIHSSGGVFDGTTYHDNTFDPANVVVAVPLSTYDRISDLGGRPSGSAWDPLGIPAGSSYWFLPQGSSGASGAGALGAPYAGVETEALNFGQWQNNEVRFSLISVTGPGHFSLYQGGPEFFMTSADGIDSSDSFAFEVGGHDHFNWAFTAAGTYQVTFGVSGTHLVDGFSSDTATYTFHVIPEPSSALLAVLGMVPLLRRRRN